MSWWATLRARLAPIVARPVRPKRAVGDMPWTCTHIGWPPARRMRDRRRPDPAACFSSPMDRAVRPHEPFQARAVPLGNGSPLYGHRLTEGAARLDVLVAPEEVVCVVAVLERDQALVLLRPVGVADAVLGSEVEVRATGRVRAHRFGERLCKVICRASSAGSSQTEIGSKRYCASRCEKAVASSGTAVTPWPIRKIIIWLNGEIGSRARSI